ncbi:zinc metalloproteinase-disintegrin-like protein H3 [Gastrophryne carolinensis]
MLRTPTLLLLLVLGFQVLALNRLPAGLKYEVVVPEKVHSWHKRDTQSKYPDQVQYKFPVEGNPVHLYLLKTEGLIAKDYTETRYLDDGTPVTTKPEYQDHCCYYGHVKNDDDSMARICTCQGLSGVFHLRKRRFLMEPLNQTDDGEHVVYETKEETPKTCGVTNTTWIDGKIFKSSRSGSNIEKQNFLNSQKYVKVYLVADKSIFKKYNNNTERCKERFFEMINYVNELYLALHTFVAVIGIEIWQNKDQFEVVTAAGTNLDRLSAWRKNSLLPRKPHDNAQFLTDYDFDGATVGLAYVGSMCSDMYSTGVIQDHSKPAVAVGATLAHEMGHNLGMNHDTSSCTCAGDSCVMSATVSYNSPRLFSSCSLQNFQEFIYDKMPECMRDVPLKQNVQSPSVCGNKFTEIGEDCDCGSVKECTNPCCNAATCKFKANAQCAEGLCCQDCKIKNKGIVCRPIKDDCDLHEMCDGKSAECPQDGFIYNGYPCNNRQGYCYNGKCPTLENQCTYLWGASALVGGDSCFNLNRRGVNYGYCRKVEGSYVPCGAADTKCGVLYCSGGSSTPKIAAPVASISNCRAVLHQEAMVQNGTICGEGKVCFSGICVSVNTAFRSDDCSANCPGHGVCDHELQCRCQEGWAPPTCDSTSETNIGIIVAVILIALALVSGLILMFVFRKKIWKCGRRSPAVSGATNPAYIGPQARKKSGIVSTPEMSSKNLLYPVPPVQSQKPQISHPQSKDGYLAPQYSVTTSAEINRTPPALQRPINVPPPVPTPAPPAVAATPPPVPANKPVPVTAPPPVPQMKPTAPPPVPATKPTPPVKALKPPVK